MECASSSPSQASGPRESCYAVESIKALLLLNGGAAVALLTLGACRAIPAPALRARLFQS